MTRFVCCCSIDEDPRVDRAVFIVLAENGYDEKNAFRALDKLIEVFWINFTPEFLKTRTLADFQFTEDLRPEFESIMVERIQSGTIFRTEAHYFRLQ